MATSSNETAEKIKSTFKGTAEKSRETIRTIIDSNANFFNSALDFNKMITDSMKKSLNQQKTDGSVNESLKNTYGKTIEMAETAIDSLINSYNRQMDLYVDLNSKLLGVDALTKMQKDSISRFSELATGWWKYADMGKHAN